jgi:hypothetical protein
MKRILEPFIQNQALIADALEKTRRDYRPLDPGWYLYRILMQEKDLEHKFTDQFVELVYVTLASWNMNSRGAKLAGWDLFKSSIYNFREPFLRLSPCRLEKITKSELDGILNGQIREMFFRMQLVDSGKPHLVTYSKAFHFYLPDLFVPIDRKYTLTYFYGNGFVPTTLEQQFKRFCELQQEFRRFANCVPLSHAVDDSWNGSIPKVIDNMIIGHQKLHE